MLKGQWKETKKQQWDIVSAYKSTNILIRIFYILLAISPIGLALINTVQYWMAVTPISKWIILLFSLLSIVGILFVLHGRELTGASEIVCVVVVTVLAFTLRLLATDLLQTYPVSDAMTSFYHAQAFLSEGKIRLDRKEYYTQFMHWGNWAIVLGEVMRIFGRTLQVAKTFSVIISSLNVPIYYYAVKNICKNTRIALIAMLFIALSPGMICYSGVLCNDHMTALVTALFFLFLSLAHKYREQNNIKKALLFYVLAAINMGLFEAFKMAGFLLILAMVIGETVTNIVPAFWTGIKNKEWKDFFRKTVTSCVLLTIMLMVYKGTIYIDTNIYVKKMGVERSAMEKVSEDKIYCNLWMGLNPETKGMYDASLVEVRDEMRERYPDASERNKQYKEMLKENLKDTQTLREILSNKFDEIWGNESYSGEWIFIGASMRYDTEAPEDKQLRYNEGYLFLAVALRNIAATYWWLLLFGGIIGAVSMIFKKSDYTFLISMIYLFGFMLLMELMIVSARYKMIVYFPLIILSAYGYSELHAILEKGMKLLRMKAQKSLV